MRKPRKLQLASGEWQYTIGQSHVRIIGPDSKSHDVGLAEVSERDPNTLERGQWKRTSDGMVTPRHIRTYIEKHLLGQEPR